MNQKVEGTGSIWNVNNWHWENKNCTKEGIDLLNEKFLNLKFKRDDLEFTVFKIEKISGEGSFEMRKGKILVLYEYDIEGFWRAESANDECDGKFIIKDINDNDFDFEVCGLTLENSGKIGMKAKNFLKKMFRDEIIKLIKNMPEELLKIENDKKKLEEDKKIREENDKILRETQEKTGQLKEKMLEEQKKKDLDLKNKFSKI